LSGTVLVGYNVGIVNDISKEKLQPAIEAIKYFTSENIQKELVLKEYIISAMTSLYEDMDVCSKIKFCDFYKSPQPTKKLSNDDILNPFYEYLYGNKTVMDALKSMDNLSATSGCKKPYNLNTIFIYLCNIYIIYLLLQFFNFY